MKKQTLLSISMLALLVSAAGSPLPGITVPAYAAADELPTLADLDKTVVAAATRALQELAEGKAIVLDDIKGQNKEHWVLAAKDDRGEVLVNKTSGEIVSVRVRFKLDEVNESLQAAVESTLKDLDAKGALRIDQVERVKWQKESAWKFTGDNVQVAIDPETGKLLHASAEYELGQVDPEIVQAAQEKINQLSGGQSLVLSPSVTLYQNPQKHIDTLWAFGDKDGNYAVGIGANTGKVVSVKMASQVAGENFVWENDIPQVFAQPFYTKEKAVAAAGPAVKQHFQIDLTGYDASVQFDTYTFTKPGMPTVIAKINKQGTFWDFLVTPENRLAN